MPRGRKRGGLALPSREGSTAPMPRLPRDAVLSRQCPGCGEVFTPAYPRQMFHSYECGQKHYRKRGMVRSRGYRNPPIEHKPAEVVSVEKKIGLVQAQAHQVGVVEVMEVNQLTCDNCGGPVFSDPGYGFVLCGGCS